MLICLAGFSFVLPPVARATSQSPDAQSLFDQAVAADLGRGAQPDAARAFALYRQAADEGLAVAQLNVAVMLDSGRGTPHDAARAATYYALAASQGVARAAYDLGQLYADGEGVPRNPDLALAWLKRAAASGVPAAYDRIQTLQHAPADAGAIAIGAPQPVLASTDVLRQGEEALQFVWTARVQPAPAQFFVEVSTLQPPRRDVFTALTPVSALSARLDVPPGRYAWRVFTVCPSIGRYAASAWVAFRLD